MATTGKPKKSGHSEAAKVQSLLDKHVKRMEAHEKKMEDHAKKIAKHMKRS